MPVGQMLASLSARELAEYMAFDQIEPIGEPRADLRAGIVASAVVNHGMHAPKEPTRPTDFMPFARKPRTAIDLADKVEQGKLIAQLLFGIKVQHK